MGTMAALQALNAEPAPRPIGTDNRRYRRYSVVLSGRFHRGKTSSDCIILDLSPTGAKLKMSHPLAQKAVGTLESTRFGMIPAEVVWRNDETLGIRFLDEPNWVAGLLSMVLPMTRFQPNAV